MTRRWVWVGVLLALTVVVAACESPDTPVRLAPYQFRLAGTDTVFHWPASSLPVRFWVEPAGALPEYVDRGLRTWERQFLYGEFRGQRVADSAAAEVLVSMEGDPPPDAPLTDDPPLMVCEGVTLIPNREADSEGGTRFAGRLQVSVWWFAGFAPSDIANCLARVTAHELGHALGIFAHSADPNDLMFLRPDARAPSLRDRSTIQVLYHTPSDILPWIPNQGAPAVASTPIR